MREMQMMILRSLKTRACAGLVVLPMFLFVLGGCAIKKKQTVDAEAPVAKESSVARLEDGREGFVITEVPELDETSRKDFDRAVAMLKVQDYDQAIELLERIIEQSPGVTAPYIDVAIAYQHIGNTEQAEQHLKTALAIFPDHPVACNEYGLLYRKTGRFAESRKMYEKVLARFPEYYPAHKNLGILCDLYLSDLACALEHYKTYSKAAPGDEQIKLWIADLSARLGSN